MPGWRMLDIPWLRGVDQSEESIKSINQSEESIGVLEEWGMQSEGGPCSGHTQQYHKQSFPQSELCKTYSQPITMSGKQNGLC